MAWLISGGIPNRGLPLWGWPERGIPGGPIVAPSGYKAGGGVGWVPEYPTRDLWKLKRDDRDLLEIIAAITRVLN